MQSVQIGGKTTLLGKRIGRGGEGDVYAFATGGDQAIKVYKDNLRRSREGKVRAMVESRLAEKTNLVAFPVNVATDSAGAFTGFTMRLVAGYRAIHELYSPKSRKLHFPTADYRFLVRAAQNIARAVATVHQAGCVIGDFNHSGVLVSKDATVALIDADSFQFKLGGQAYPCVVGTEDFTPPELHGINLSQIERTVAHDNFGLAVAIFQLLCMGKHPYAGRYSGAGDLSLGEAIARHLFAYSVLRKDTTRTTPPPGAIKLEDFPPQLAAAFEAAFGLNPQARPSPATWVTLLGELETNLRQCSKVRTHYFPHAAKGCIWCRLTDQSGVEMFPQAHTSGPVPSGAPFDLAKISAAIRATPLPRPLDVLPTWSGDISAPSPALAEAKQGQAGQRTFGAIALAIALLGFIGAKGGFPLWIGLAIFGVYRLFSAKTNPAPLLKAFKEADSRVQSASLAFLRRIGYTEIFALRSELESCVVEYQRVEGELTKTLDRLRATREERQRTAFLDGFLIRRVKIHGIGPAKTATLASFGIESAADINYAAVRAVPGFGEALTGSLLQWRREQEAKFRYNPNPSPDDTLAENDARSSSANRKLGLQKKLQAGLAALQAAPANFAAKKASPDQALLHALLERARVERDCQTLGIAVPPHGSINVNVPPPAAPAPQPPAPPRPSYRPAQAPPKSSGTPSCPRCGSTMIRRRAHKGAHAGNQFWGCSRFPSCKGTRN
ncbi:helix-hairpin-helix domain-containing protein [Dyella agri]|uniref:Topoisomerase DNA-binding C4 zinc finger domain-containing protein n=1 Tax=Dyella agri TaxID=1926869 RepID=A0ABW8KC97_9GAMM